MDNKYCYMTFTDIKFIPCVIRQSQRMKYLNMKYPYIVLIDENDEECELLLKENNIEYRTIKQEFFKGDFSLSDKRFKKTINKFKIVHYLNEFEKICWLDADTICGSNIDQYFDEIQNHLQFYGSFDIFESRINGQIFYITNKLNVNDFLTFVQKYQDKYTEDESLLTDYFKWHENISLNFINPDVLHFGGYIKIFSLSNIFPFIKKIFYSYTANEFNIFIDKNRDALSWVNFNWDCFLEAIAVENG